MPAISSGTTLLGRSDGPCSQPGKRAPFQRACGSIPTSRRVIRCTARRAIGDFWSRAPRAASLDGAAVLKPDYGDRIPEDTLFFDGRTGREMHNLYLHVYTETAWEAVKECTGESIVWQRPGYIGTRRTPGPGREGPLPRNPRGRSMRDRNSGPQTPRTRIPRRSRGDTHG